MTSMILFIIFSFLSGITLGIIEGIINQKRNQNISQSFCNANYIYGKFADQNELYIDEVVKKDFKLLDI